MKIEYQCSNCAKREVTSAFAGVPYSMWVFKYRAVGDALYCPDCVNTWSERNGKSFDEQYGEDESRRMFRNWWNSTVYEQADREGKTLNTYHMTAWGDYAEG